MEFLWVECSQARIKVSKKVPPKAGTWTMLRHYFPLQISQSSQNGRAFTGTLGFFRDTKPTAGQTLKLWRTSGLQHAWSLNIGMPPQKLCIPTFAISPLQIREARLVVIHSNSPQTGISLSIVLAMHRLNQKKSPNVLEKIANCRGWIGRGQKKPCQSAWFR